jgi:hypothetical protein
VKFQNAIQAIQRNPDDPAFAPYVNNLHSAGVALQSGSDPNLTASAMAAYLQQGLRVYQANMSVNGDPKTGINAWNNLSPSRQNALLVQFYKQGPTPDRVLRNMVLATRNGDPYVPQIGADGAGARYVANEAAIAQALAGGPADFSSRWDALGPSAANFASDQRAQVPNLDQYRQYLASIGLTPSGRVNSNWPSADAFTPSNGLPSWLNKPTKAYGFPSVMNNAVTSPSGSRPVSVPQNDSLTQPGGSNSGSWAADTINSGRRALAKGLDYFLNNVLTTPAEGATPVSGPSNIASGRLSNSLDPQNDPFGKRLSSIDISVSRNPNVPGSVSEGQGPIGIFSGKPMRVPFAAIFDTRDRSAATGAPNRSNALDDLISNFGRSQASPFDTGAAASPFAPNPQNPFDNGNGIASAASGPGDGSAPPTLAPQNPQGPLSLNDAYLEYLKRLNAGRPQAPAFDPNASWPPLAPPDDSNFSGGLLGRLLAVMGVDPQNPGKLAPPPSDDDLRAFYGDPGQAWSLQRLR